MRAFFSIQKLLILYNPPKLHASIIKTTHPQTHKSNKPQPPPHYPTATEVVLVFRMRLRIRAPISNHLTSAETILGRHSAMEIRSIHLGGLFHAEEEIQMTSTMANFMGQMQGFVYNGHR